MRRTISLDMIYYTKAVPTGTVGYWVVPAILNNYKFVSINCAFIAASASGESTFIIKRSGSSIMSTDCIIDSGEMTSYTGTPGASTATLSTGNVLEFYVSAVGSGAKGLQYILEVEK